MRLATLGLFHEANTFSPLLADQRVLDDGNVLRGDEITERYADSAATMGGFLAANQWAGVEVVPRVFACLTPMGALTGDAFGTLVDEMLDSLAAGEPWDGVLLVLHGAAVAEHILDADGEIATRVRQLVGPDVPVGATLDLHANISQRLVDALTVTTVYQTNPHIDARDRAADCADLIVRTVRGQIRPEQALLPLPLVANIARQDTGEPPMSRLITEAASLAKRPGMLSVSLVEGFPYADVPHLGMSCLAIHDGDEAAARSAAQDLAEEVWASRDGLQARGMTVEDALDAAEREPRGPVVLLDVGDNIGGGAPGDSTAILIAAIKRGMRSLVQTLCDPDAVRECIVADIGSTVRLAVGARHSHSAGEPVMVEGRVRLISDGRFEDASPTHGGFRYHDMGLTAVLETTDGHTLVLTSKPTMNSSLEQLLSLGIEPLHFHVIVAKGVNSPRAAYHPIATRMLVVDTDGVTAMGLERFDYRHRRTPIHPFEHASFPEVLADTGEESQP